VLFLLMYIAPETCGTRMNIDYSYGLIFFGVAPSRTDSRFDTVEVWGSSPHEPTTPSY
jgi:hypothetical protein